MLNRKAKLGRKEFFGSLDRTPNKLQRAAHSQNSSSKEQMGWEGGKSPPSPLRHPGYCSEEVQPRDRPGNILLLKAYKNNLQELLINSQLKAEQAAKQKSPHFSPFALFSLNKAKNLQTKPLWDVSGSRHLRREATPWFPAIIHRRHKPEQDPAWPLISHTPPSMSFAL